MTSNEEKPELPETASMPFLDHLEELRRRLLKSLAAVVVMALVAFYFSDWLMRFLIIPLGDIKLHVTQVTGSFYAYLKVALVSGIVGASPIVFYQLWSFIAPGLYPHEKARVLPLVTASTFLFLLGASFCYLVVLPLALKFLIGFSRDLFNPIITIDSYLSFSGMLMLAFGIGFEMPVAAYFLGRIGLISSRLLSKGRRYAIVLILIVAAVLTTPDVATQLLLAIPLYVLYEVSIIVVKITGRREEPDTEDSPSVDKSEDQR
jgi:sec-independent protein translocase protein TatC